LTPPRGKRHNKNKEVAKPKDCPSVTTPIVSKVKTLMHEVTKQTSKHTKTTNINKCTKVQNPKKCKEQMHMEKHGLGFGFYCRSLLGNFCIYYASITL
jgi:hypothetical protein